MGHGGQQGGGDYTFDVRFFQLSDELTPYFTALYSFEFVCAGGCWIGDFLHPEWTAMRFFTDGENARASIVPDLREERAPFVVSGPTTKAINFSVSTCRVMGLGLQPAGLARYSSVPASALANSIVDGSTHEAFAAFAPLLRIVEACGADREEAASQINSFIMELPGNEDTALDRVLLCQDAIRDPDIADVEELAECVGVNRRTLERLCAKSFGFPPKQLLRRQRFLRSLARFMLEGRRTWSDSLDEQYYDQAHFVRDFRSFMGMTPSEYAEMDHPILDRIIAQRLADAGAAPQTHLPTVLRYAASRPTR